MTLSENGAAWERNGCIVSPRRKVKTLMPVYCDLMGIVAIFINWSLTTGRISPCLRTIRRAN